MKGDYPIYTTSVLRYLALEYFRHYGKIFSYDLWRVCIYSNQPAFPDQTDSHSCGPYICMMAKAIVYMLHFSFHPQAARFTIATELKTQALHSVPTLDDRLKMLGCVQLPIFCIQSSVPVQYIRLLDAEHSNTVIIFSVGDREILHKSALTYGKKVVLMNYSTQPTLVTNLNEEGEKFRDTVDPNIFNFLMQTTSFKAALTHNVV